MERLFALYLRDLLPQPSQSFGLILLFSQNLPQCYEKNINRLFTYSKLFCLQR